MGDIENREKFFNRVGLECSCHPGYNICRNCEDYYNGKFVLPADSIIVKVEHEFGFRFYSVRNVERYIGKCKQENKKAVYIGETDNFGNLK